MIQEKETEIFPRPLSESEKKILFSVLPENKIGYRIYRDKISAKLVIGFGRFGGSNLILGNKDSSIDLDQPSSSVFAVGEVELKDNHLDVLIHEEDEEKIEFDISYQNENVDFNSIEDSWSYSDWIPGMNAPKNDSVVREIVIVKEKFILAIVEKHEKIWLHDIFSGINSIIPVTNYYNSLMMNKKIRDSKVLLNPKSIFKNLSNFSDEDLTLALFAYDKYFKRFDLSKYYISNKSNELKTKSLFSIFKKDKNL